MLWIDSICIDQTSIPERNQQVKHMGEIYTKAQRVVVWLGEKTAKSEIAFKYIEKLAGAAIISNVRARDHAFHMLLARMKEEGKQCAGPNIPVLDCLMQDVFSRTWFTRLWTIQEVALARKTIVVCGNTEISFEVLVYGSNVIAKLQAEPGSENTLTEHGVFSNSIALHNRLVQAIEHNRSPETKMFRISVARPTENPAPLRRSTILELARGKNATEKKDKVFALYGLFEALNIIIIGEVDYRHSLADIYVYETIAAMQEDRSLDMFYSLTNKSDALGLPSWIPDWSDTTSPRCTQYWAFAASGTSIPSSRGPFDGLKLAIYARTLDTISRVADNPMPLPTPSSSSTNPPFHTIIPTIHSWAHFCNPDFTTKATFPDSPYVTNYFSPAAFCEILVRGNAPLPDPWGAIDLPPTRIIQPEKARMDYLHDIAACWGPIATSSSTALLYERLMDYPSSIVSDDVLTGIERAIAGTPKARIFHRMVEIVSGGLDMFGTERGFLGTGLEGVREGDVVVLIAGLRMPFLLRPVGGMKNEWRVLGPVYVYGAMGGGEWWDEDDMDKVVEFVLV
ncbi:HET-domain-containing protein [Amniculicola lignicola CBS 123094]|uniref:HET-domain-containing protein n=1 Tax=Amniculicola lignicola CBS 123094 TaxID=1392246 RepID=A0A6A5WII2_9PLEO|nr:HET-domain-containing protein [Amniculicola lignicola CBS 123094]